VAAPVHGNRDVSTVPASGCGTAPRGSAISRHPEMGAISRARPNWRRAYCDELRLLVGWGHRDPRDGLASDRRRCSRGDDLSSSGRGEHQGENGCRSDPCHHPNRSLRLKHGAAQPLAYQPMQLRAQMRCRGGRGRPRALLFRRARSRVGRLDATAVHLGRLRQEWTRPVAGPKAGEEAEIGSLRVPGRPPPPTPRAGTTPATGEPLSPASLGPRPNGVHRRTPSMQVPVGSR
jgi:hypothetical protein